MSRQISGYIDEATAIKALKRWNIDTKVLTGLFTADVRENVKGEWVQDEIAKKLNVYLCSNCNIPTQIVDSEGNTKLTRYCPNCGADMRGEA